MFENINWNEFWKDSTYSKKNYIGEKVTKDLIEKVEKQLGYKLPQSYIEFMMLHNGGLVKMNACPCDSPTSWDDDHVGITGFLSIGDEKEYSLLGTLGSQFWIDEWEYPDIGIAICDCPSAGHDMIFLDYRDCGPEGEPAVVHVDQEFDYEITRLADNFEEFVNKLVEEKSYSDEEDD